MKYENRNIFLFIVPFPAFIVLKILNPESCILNPNCSYADLPS
jgi:hypothetical protein